MFWVTGNAAYLWGADQALNYVSAKVDNYEGLAMFGAFSALTTLWPFVNKYGFNPLSKKIWNFQKNNLSLHNK